ncbi:CHAT domain-containing protein [Xylaria sp. FL1042]|nr:CHAT domain-containing protein [Xylaria sp. FL1042]
MSSFKRYASQLISITESATELLSLVSPRSIRQQDQQYLLRRYAGLASTAAAAALQAGKSKEQALRLLEHGRGTITSTLLQNRRSVSLLQRKHPAWAKKFEELRDALDPPHPFVVDGPLSNAPQVFAPMTLSGTDRYRTTEELNELLKQIRSDDIFKTFLLPLTIEELVSAAPRNQTVVAINIARFRCDAFLIQSDQVSIVELPDLTHQQVEAKTKCFRQGKNREAYEILEWLWTTAIERILARIGADKPCFGHDYAKWPRVYWVPTGPLRLLPIHAAGYHRDDPGCSVIDRVISSYSLSVEEILNGQEIKARTREARQIAQPAPYPRDQTTEAPCKFVLVSMESTPGNSSLPYAREEVHAVCEMLPPCLPHKSFDHPSRDSLLRALSGCTVFHFAGHGATDPHDPSLSGLLLRSDDSKYTMALTVRDLQALRFQETRPPLLAYLSACSTGRIDDDQLVDEGIHLMGACRLAGFRHVIGSLWEVSDRLCVDVARTVYSTILEAYLDDASVAYGLHHAVRMLRTKLEGAHNGAQRNVKKLSRKRRRGPYSWAAFIHTGI